MKDRLRKLRRTLDLTQAEFAGQIGTVQNAIASYETGRRNPSRSVIDNICKTFSVNEEWLRTGNGPMFVQRERSEEIAALVDEVLADESDSFRRRFIAALSHLSIEDWKAIENFAVSIVEEKAAPAPLTDEDIERELADYRAQLEAEKKAGEKSSASHGGRGA